MEESDDEMEEKESTEQQAVAFPQRERKTERQKKKQKEAKFLVSNVLHFFGKPQNSVIGKKSSSLHYWMPQVEKILTHSTFHPLIPYRTGNVSVHFGY